MSEEPEIAANGHEEQENKISSALMASSSYCESLCVFSSNVDVFSVDKLMELNTRIKNMTQRPHILAIQEVKPKNFRFERELLEYGIDGYDVIAKNLGRADEGRGLLMYVKKGLPYSIVSLEEEYCEYLSIKIECHLYELIITSVYRSPAGDVENNSKLLNLIQKLSNLNVKYKIICGDFNMPGTDWKFWTVKAGSEQFCFDFIEKIRDCYLHQHVYEVTRFRDGSVGNVLDLIFTNDEFMVEKLVVDSPIGKSDHGCVLFNCDINPLQRKHCKTVYMMEKADWKRLRQILNID